MLCYLSAHTEQIKFPNSCYRSSKCSTFPATCLLDFISYRVEDFLAGTVLLIFSTPLLSPPLLPPPLPLFPPPSFFFCLFRGRRTSKCHHGQIAMAFIHMQWIRRQLRDLTSRLHGTLVLLSFALYRKIDFSGASGTYNKYVQRAELCYLPQGLTNRSRTDVLCCWARTSCSIESIVFFILYSLPPILIISVIIFFSEMWTCVIKELDTLLP